MAIKKIIVTMLMSLLLLTTLPVKTVKAYSYQEFLNNCSESYQTGTYFENLKNVLEEKAPTMAGTADLVIEVARSQIGYYEGDNSNQLNGEYHGSNNYNEYSLYCGYGVKGGWCNFFVSWCLAAADINIAYTTKVLNPYFTNKESVKAFYSWADYINDKFEFEKGDIIIYSNSDSASISGKDIVKIPTGGHVAIFDKKINGKYNTIDGNTNGNGVCVDEKFRTFDPSTGKAWTDNGVTTYVYMVIRPNYVSSCNHLTDPNSEINKTGYCSEHDTWLPIEDDNYKYNQDGSLFVLGTYKEKVVNGSSVAIYRNQPYKSSPSLNINFSTVEVIGCVKNGLGNIWYKVKNGTNTYYCFSENLEFVSPIDSTLSINPEHETYTIQKGTSCNVLGTISSNYNITRVTATLNGTKYVDKNPNSESFDIGTSSAGYINSFKGAELPVGDNYIIITATDTSGKTISKTIKIKVVDNSQPTPTTYQITYNANDGVGVPNNQTKTQGVTLYLSTTIPTREHHTFLGYSTYLGGPIVYQPGDAYTVDSGATLYANWTYNYGFQVIGVLDGATTYSTAEYGTYDIYINDKLVAQNASDYWNEFPVGTTYEVVLHLDEHYWLDTVNSSSLSGTIQDHTPIYLGINTNLYPLDLNAFIDGQYKPMLGEGVTCDLYINGQLEAEGISDHYQYYKYGTSYEFKNFRSTEKLALETIATAEEYNNDSYKDRIGIVDGPTNVNVKMHTCFENSNDYRDNISKIEKFNGHTYLYFDSKLSWYDANSICKLLGGHLVTLTSEEENSFVDNFTEHNIIWTGGLCNANREWKWINNEVFQYSNWDMNWGLAQPNNGDAPDNIEGCEEYIILNFNEFSKGKWHDDAGSHVWNFVCEIDSVANDFNSNESLINTPTEYNKEWIIDVLKNNIATVGESININGKPFTVNSDNGVKMLEDANVVTVYATANNTSADRHVQYPKSMRVYTIESNPLNQLVAHPNLDNILSYAGASIRVTGNKGIRIITSIPTSKKNQLINDGIDGYQVMEYGTLMCWASDLANDEEPTLYKDSNGTFKANHGAKGRAYSRESNIYTIYSEGGGTTKYTNTLVGNYTDQQCASDFAMRSYMILRPKGNKNADGDIVVYGGTLYRSISYVAYQNKNAFSAGSNNYEYIWSLIRAGYGNQYDNEYKGNK